MSPDNPIEDRLRDALTELADATDLSPDAWTRVEERTRRRRVLPRTALALAATLGTVLAVIVAVALVARDDGGPDIATSGAPEGRCGAEHGDVEVVLEPGTSAAQRDAVRQVLEDDPSVGRFSFQSRDEGFRILRCVFAGSPERVAAVDPTHIPAIFHVTLRAGAEHVELVRRLEELSGVFAAGPRCSPPSDLDVYLTLSQATPESVESVAMAIDQLRGVARRTFVSQDEAYQEFACFFADQPDLVEETTSNALPPSFRLVLEPAADWATLIESLRAIPGVDAVIDKRDPTQLPVLDPDDFGPAPDGYTEIGRGRTGDTAWRLSVRSDGAGRFSALLDSLVGPIELVGVDDETSWDSRATAGDGMTLGLARPEVARVRLEPAVGDASEVDTIGAPEPLRGRFFVVRIPLDVVVTVVALDADGRELYRLALEPRPPETPADGATP
jgi:hypothetical protein